MKHSALWIICLCLVWGEATSFAQYERGSIDTVFSFTPGTGQTSGQEPPYFPHNIFGLPDTAAREDVPAVSPYRICSLGLHGVIVVGFNNAVLRDGAGPDFTVFENAFRYNGGKKLYAEPAKVAVSRDGITFVEFPFDTLSLHGCAGVQPTIGNADPFLPSESGGDSFDLAAIGMDSIRYIKITDISAIVKDNPKHPYWDPTISGFDLDAVIALYLEKNSSTHETLAPRVVVRAGVLSLLFSSQQTAERATVALYTLEGRRIGGDREIAVQSKVDVPLPSLAQGIYIVVVTVGNHRFVSTVYYGE